MPTTPLGIWTPDDSDDWDLTVDLAATAVSVDTALGTQARTSGTPRVADQAARTTLFPSPVMGDRVYRLDRGWVEQYFTAYNATTNPGGASTAGWYPISGRMPYAVARGTSALGVTTNQWAIGNIALTAGFEHGGFSASGASNYYIGVPFPGLYDVQAWTTWSSSANGSLRGVRIALDNASVVPTFYETRRHAVSGSAFALSGSFSSVAVASNIQLQVYQDTGGALNSNDRVLVARYLGPVGVIQNAV